MGMDELLSAAAAATTAKKGYGMTSSPSSTAVSLTQEGEVNWCGLGHPQHPSHASAMNPTSSQLPSLSAHFVGIKRSVDKGERKFKKAQLIV